MYWVFISTKMILWLCCADHQVFHILYRMIFFLYYNCLGDSKEWSAYRMLLISRWGSWRGDCWWNDVGCYQFPIHFKRCPIMMYDIRYTKNAAKQKLEQMTDSANKEDIWKKRSSPIQYPLHNCDCQFNGSKQAKRIKNIRNFIKIVLAYIVFKEQSL